MGVYISGMEMPKEGTVIAIFKINGKFYASVHGTELCPLIPVPPHGMLIDADALRAKMYHEAFETDTPMQKWDSGCWIRYKLFEMTEESAPTIIPADEPFGKSEQLNL